MPGWTGANWRIWVSCKIPKQCSRGAQTLLVCNWCLQKSPVPFSSIFAHSFRFFAPPVSPDLRHIRTPRTYLAAQLGFDMAFEWAYRLVGKNDVDWESSLEVVLRVRVADLLLVVVLAVVFLFTGAIEPFQRQFFVGDLTISHPFAEHERVTNHELFLYCLIVPFVMILVALAVTARRENRLLVTYISLMGLVTAVFLTSVVTDILKNFFGRHRPDFLARCVPKKGTPLDVMVYAKDVCTTKNHDRLLDGFRTTPSGHSSLSFAGLGYLSLWLSGQLVVTSPNVSSWRVVAAWVPAFGAALIALSRTMDYRHHFVDVFVGSVLGMTLAVVIYRQHFPPLNHKKAYEPYLVHDSDERETEEYTA